MTDDDDLASRMRAICLAIPDVTQPGVTQPGVTQPGVTQPGVTERPSHGAPTWFVSGKRAFVTLWASGHHDNKFPHLWCANVPEGQAELIAVDPDRYFRPPYVGHRGWVGVRLDREPDWSEVAELCQDAYRLIAGRSR